MSWSIRHPSDRTAASPRACGGTTTARKRRRSFRPPRFPSPRYPRRLIPSQPSGARHRRCSRGLFYPTSSAATMRTRGAGRPTPASGALRGGPGTPRRASWAWPDCSGSTRPGQRPRRVGRTRARRRLWRRPRSSRWTGPQTPSPWRSPCRRIHWQFNPLGCALELGMEASGERIHRTAVPVVGGVGDVLVVEADAHFG